MATVAPDAAAADADAGVDGRVAVAAVAAAVVTVNYGSWSHQVCVWFVCKIMQSTREIIDDERDNDDNDVSISVYI